MQKMLITKLVRTEATRAALYAPRHQYPDLTLFELGMLATVGIDYQNLPMGTPVPCLFYALWEESENLNQHGNPYKDIVALEPAQATESQNPLADLARQWLYSNTLLRLWLKGQGIDAPPPPDLSVMVAPASEAPPGSTPDAPPAGEGSSLAYQDGVRVDATNDAETAAFALYVEAHDGAVPGSRESLRTWFSAHPRRSQT